MQTARIAHPPLLPGLLRLVNWSEEFRHPHLSFSLKNTLHFPHSGPPYYNRTKSHFSKSNRLMLQQFCNPLPDDLQKTVLKKMNHGRSYAYPKLAKNYIFWLLMHLAWWCSGFEFLHFFTVNQMNCFMNFLKESEI